MRRVVVTGLGVVSPLGNSLDELFTRLMAGQSAIRPLQIEGPRGAYSNIGAPATRDREDAQKRTHLDRTTQLAQDAANAALASAAIELQEEARARAGVAVGTAMGAAQTLEDSYGQVLTRDPDRLHPLTILTVMNNAAAANVAIQHGLRGPSLTFSCACSSSALALGEAYRQIKHGYADVMIAGGADAMLTFGLFKAWEAIRVLATADPTEPATSCRPFAKNRTGLVLGEGAAMVVLEERERAIRRGARIWGEVAGYNVSNDPTHLTRPSVDAQAAVMRAALAEAGLSPADIGYINAHGTATLLNDLTETRAIKEVFGKVAYAVPISSTKSMHGHLLGAAGALEFAIALLAMNKRAIPPTAHLDLADPECDLDYVPNKGRYGQDIRAVLSNSFAFGGTNAALIAKKAD
jgi:3-oxoacyl-[acyl-carrier-protein] synthase II